MLDRFWVGVTPCVASKQSVVKQKAEVKEVFSQTDFRCKKQSLAVGERQLNREWKAVFNLRRMPQRRESYVVENTQDF